MHDNFMSNKVIEVIVHQNILIEKILKADSRSFLPWMVACFAEGLNFDNIVADDTTKYALFHVLHFFFRFDMKNFISLMPKKNFKLKL